MDGWEKLIEAANQTSLVMAQNRERRRMHDEERRSNVAQLKACPECGDIRMSEYRVDECRCCLGAGHKYRLLTIEELTASIEQHERDGFHLIAIKRALIRDALLSALA